MGNWAHSGSGNKHNTCFSPMFVAAPTRKRRSEHVYTLGTQHLCTVPPITK